MLPLELTNIELIGGKSKGISTNSKGQFFLNNICGGLVELHISHLQCEHIHLQFTISKDTNITIYLQHANHVFDKITFAGKGDEENSIEKANGKKLELLKGGSISEMMQNIGGIVLLKTGANISKPIVNGLHSNRVIVLNNGIRQEGQNWGMEHAPEIDGFLATEIELLKGTQAMRYAADGIGGVLMIKPLSVFNHKSGVIKWEYNLVGNSNGRGGASSIILGSKLSEKIPIYWRIQGTYKRNGNLRTPTYFLSNTGMQELNYSGALGYQNKRLKLELFYSSFYNKIAIFKGSHIGNVSDLLNAFNADTPAVRSGFTYGIERPNQQVQHQLLKANAEWQLNSKSKIQIVGSYQKNHRQEYDVLRSSTSYQGPNFNYFINTFTTDMAFMKNQFHKINLTAGVNGTYQSNSYTGRFFIPGFYNKGLATYILLDKNIGRLKLELALREDYKHLTSYLWIGNTLNVSNLKFMNGTFAFQGTYLKNKFWTYSVATSSAWRPPAPNELFSNGLHQGLATIEIGDPALKPERSFNQLLDIKYMTKKFYLETEFFAKKINGFINLIPSLPPQVTIRGAFPVYKYVQQDIVMAGLNLNLKHELKKQMFYKLNSNLLFTQNVKDGQPISQMPPLNAKLWVGKETQKTMFQIWCQATAKQNRYVFGSDYVAPPKGFILLGIDGSMDFKIKHQTFKLNISVNNLTNLKYREYLNRFRYFANETGRNITIRIIVPLQLNNKKQ